MMFSINMYMNMIFTYLLPLHGFQLIFLYNPRSFLFRFAPHPHPHLHGDPIISEPT